MNALLVAGATAGGAVVGLGTGWLSTLLERLEKLEEEENEERQEYEREVAKAKTEALAAGKDEPAAEPWIGERYGWTWLERVLAPLLGAAGFAAFTAHGPVQPGLLIHLLWVAVLVQILCFDLKHRLILNRVTYPSIAAALGLAQVSPSLTAVHALIGLAAVSLFFLFMNIISRGGIGLGDAKLGALIGAITGIGPEAADYSAAYAVVYAIFLGGGVALLLLITRIRRLKDPIPYGPFLCAGAAIILYQLH